MNAPLRENSEYNIYRDGIPPTGGVIEPRQWLLTRWFSGQVRGKHDDWGDVCWRMHNSTQGLQTGSEADWAGRVTWLQHGVQTPVQPAWSVFYPWVMLFLTVRITEAFGLPKPSLFSDYNVMWLLCSGGFRGNAPSVRPPYSPKFSQFHAVFGKIWQNHMLAPPGGLAPPPMGNPGSTPALPSYSKLNSNSSHVILI